MALKLALRVRPGELALAAGLRRRGGEGPAAAMSTATTTCSHRHVGDPDARQRHAEGDRDAPGPAVRRRPLGRAQRGRQQAHRRIRDARRARRCRWRAQIGRDAADIAFTALGEVAAGLSSDPAATRAKLAKARAPASTRGWRARSAPTVSTATISATASAEAVAKCCPALIGDIVGGAVQRRLQRRHRAPGAHEQPRQGDRGRVEPRAKALESRAEALCRRMEALDAIDDALEYRLPDGGRWTCSTPRSRCATTPPTRRHRTPWRRPNRRIPPPPAHAPAGFSFGAPRSTAVGAAVARTATIAVHPAPRKSPWPNSRKRASPTSAATTTCR